MKDSLTLEQRVSILEKQIQEPPSPTFVEFSMFMLVGFFLIFIVAVLCLKYLNRELKPK